MNAFEREMLVDRVKWMISDMGLDGALAVRMTFPAHGHAGATGPECQEEANRLLEEEFVIEIRQRRRTAPRCNG